MKILNYYQYTQDSYNRKGGSGESPWMQVTANPKNPDNFFEFDYKCIYCNVEMEDVFHETADLYNYDNGDEKNIVFQCKICGWWRYEYFNSWDSYLNNHYDVIESTYNAILRKFDVSSKEVPLMDLNKAILKDKNLIYDIAPRKMEELVKYCFENFYNCEVKHCGRSHDGGVDLVVVNSNNPILVQVKRRESPNKVERVGAVRDLLGAMYANNAKSGIFVTTATKFTSDALKLKEHLHAEKLVDQFDLIDFDRFSGMLDLVKKSKFKHMIDWAHVIYDLEIVKAGLAATGESCYKLHSDKFRFRDWPVFKG